MKFIVISGLLPILKSAGEELAQLNKDIVSMAWIMYASYFLWESVGNQAYA
jgi:hypothetical protein